jgi:hypothetical protein
MSRQASSLEDRRSLHISLAMVAGERSLDSGVYTTVGSSLSPKALSVMINPFLK